MINGLDIYYSKNIGRGLKPVSKKTASGLKPVSTNKKTVKEVHVKNMEKD